MPSPPCPRRTLSQGDWKRRTERDVQQCRDPVLTTDPPFDFPRSASFFETCRAHCLEPWRRALVVGVRDTNWWEDWNSGILVMVMVVVRKLGGASQEADKLVLGLGGVKIVIPPYTCLCVYLSTLYTRTQKRSRVSIL
jgi:hypothetical protein